eukprot:6195640-Pleurochrysis_carterae.AAC.1
MGGSERRREGGRERGGEGENRKSARSSGYASVLVDRVVPHLLLALRADLLLEKRRANVVHLHPRHCAASSPAVTAPHSTDGTCRSGGSISCANLKTGAKVRADNAGAISTDARL